MIRALTTGLTLTAILGAAALVITAPVVHHEYVPTVSDSGRPYIQGAPASQATLPECAAPDDSECFHNRYLSGGDESYVYTDHVVYYVDGRVEYPECTDDGDYCADSTW